MFGANTDEAGHAFQSESGHLFDLKPAMFRFDVGHRLLASQVEVDDVWIIRIGQECFDFGDVCRLRKLSPASSTR